MHSMRAFYKQKNKMSIFGYMDGKAGALQVGYGFLIYNCVGKCSFGREEFSDTWQSVKPYFGFCRKTGF